MVESRKSAAQRLTSVLKRYFPQALDLVDSLHGPLHGPMALELLRRWPSLKKLQRANPKTLQTFFRQYGRRNDEKIKEQVQQIRALLPLTEDAAILLRHRSGDSAQRPNVPRQRAACLPEIRPPDLSRVRRPRPQVEPLVEGVLRATSRARQTPPCPLVNLLQIS